ncbi:MAG: hypothetical protein Q7O66_16665 [Dehalococcoidia bacterium]|nr:hypothetical protein [Dehalococcoidia bacterium]
MTTATVEDMEIKRQEILAAMRSMTGAPPESGEVQVGDVIHTGDAELDVQMIVSDIKGAGIAYIWDTRTGERSRTNKNMLPTQLTKRREDGSLVFTQHDPGIVPLRGTLRCMLHADLREKHPEYDRWGLPLCPKANLASPQDVKSHMQMRHKREWATIEDDRIEREKAEDRQLQRENARATLAALEALAPTSVSVEPAETPVLPGRAKKAN